MFQISSTLGSSMLTSARGVAAADAVVVDLAAGPAGPLVAHLPEVVLAAEGQHARRRQQLQPAGGTARTFTGQQEAHLGDFGTPTITKSCYQGTPEGIFLACMS